MKKTTRNLAIIPLFLAAITPTTAWQMQFNNKVENSTNDNSYFESIILGIIASVFVVVFILNPCYKFLVKEFFKSKGWFRLSLVIGAGSTIIDIVLYYIDEGGIGGGNELLDVLFSSLSVGLVIFTFTLFSRSVYLWVKEGFKE